MSFPFPSSNGEEPPPKKKASLLLLPLPQTTISSLPDDLLLSCFTRVSRLYYPTLSLVSKKFRTLLASPELYVARSLLGRNESCIYVCFSDPNPRWFILCRKPNGKKKKKKSFGYVLATIPNPQSPSAYPGLVVADGSSIFAMGRLVVAVGSNIYAIGGYSYMATPSSSVSILDCRSHTWHVGPSMRAEWNSGHANACDGKIYVAGGCQDKNDSSNLMEVYDPKTQTWETVLSLVAENCVSQINMSAVIEGEILMYGSVGKGLAYKPKEDRWTSFAWMPLMFEWHRPSPCVIDKVLYCYSRVQGGLIWYDSNIELWVNVFGLKRLPKIPNYSFAKLVSYGGKMAVLWLRFKPNSACNYKAVWCAVIAFERRNNNEIWGNVESIDEDVLTLPCSYVYECAVTASIC